MTTQQLSGPEPFEPRGAVIARRIREVMAGRRLRGKEMAHALDMSQPAFSRRLIGELEFAPSQIERIASVLQVNEAYLYGFTDDRSPRRSAPGGGSMFVLSERTVGLSPALRACRDSNPKPSDLVLTVRRWVALLGHLVFGDRIPVQTSELDGGEEPGAVIIEFPVHRAAAARIQAGEWPDDPGPDPGPTSARPTLLKVVS